MANIGDIRKMAIAILAIMLSVFLAKAEKTSVTVATAGTLSTILESLETNQITSLSIRGELDGADIAVLRLGEGKLATLEELDLQHVTLVPGETPYYSSAYHGDGVWYTNYTRYFIATERRHHKWAGGLSMASPQYDDYYDYNLAGAFQGMQLKRVVLPASINEIGREAFKGCTNLQEIVMPQLPVFVGNNACNGCTALTRVPDMVNVKQMEPAAFRNCSRLCADTIFKTIHLQQLDSIPSNAFEGCSNIEQVELSPTLSYMDSRAFSRCGLKSVTLPNEYTRYGSKAFADCSELLQVEVPDGLCRIPYDLFMGCPWYQDPIRVNRGIRYVGNIATQMEDETTELHLKQSTVGIADNFNGNFGSSTPKNCLETVDFPSGLRYVGICAFKDAKIESASLGNVLEIGDSAFYNCSKLAHADFSSTLKAIGKEAFCNCILTEVHIPEGVTAVGSNAFWGNMSLKKVIYEPDSAVCRNLFFGCTAIEDFTLGPKVRHIPAGLFQACVNIKEIIIPEHVKSVGERAFCGCSNVRKLFIGSQVKYIENGAFALLDSLVELEYLPDAIINSGLLSSSGSPRLEQVTIGKNVRKLTYDSFRKCPNLKQLNYNAENLQSTYVFSTTPIEHITFGQSVKSIPEGTFKECMNLKEIILPDSLTDIGQMAFSGCDSIRRIHIGKQLQTIGWHTFHCWGLEEVYYNAIHLENGQTKYQELFSGLPCLSKIVFGPDVQVLPKYAISNLDGLKHLDIADNIEILDEYAIRKCKQLKSIYFGKNLKRIKLECITECDSLDSIYYNAEKAEYVNFTSIIEQQIKHLTFGPDVKEAPKYFNFPLITTLTLNKGLEKIAGFAFYECTGLEEVTIPQTVTSIWGLAFGGCTNLKRVKAYYKQSPTPVWPETFSNETYANAILYVPTGTTAEYRNTDGWKDFQHIEEMSETPITVESITQLIDLYLSGTDEVSPETDLDNDGKISVSDITLLINLYLDDSKY